jgi:NitT/TauT family transport system permease protein
LPFFIFYIVWFLGASLLGPERLPGPGRTAILFFKSALREPIILAQGGGSHGFLPHVASTLVHTCIGCVIGTFAGLLATLLLCNKRSTFWIFDSLIEIVRVLPPLIFVPFAILVFVSSSSVEIVSVALYSFFSMGMYSLTAIANVPEEYVALSRLLNAGRIRTLLMTKLPAILPSLIGPLRTISSLGLGIAIVAEFLATPTGIGRVMKFALSYGRADLILVGIVWAVLLVLLFDCVIALGANWILPWTTRGRALQEGAGH